MKEILNPQNGNFNINEFIIFPGQSYNEINAYNIPKETTKFENGFSWIYIRKIKVENLFFHVSIGFYNKKVNTISFSFSQGTESSNWDDWSENEEKNNQQKLENWLIEKLGNSRKFSWGEIETSFDMKGGFSSIKISYK